MTGHKYMPTASYWDAWTAVAVKTAWHCRHWRRAHNWIFWWKRWDASISTMPSTTGKVSRKRWNFWPKRAARNWKAGKYIVSRPMQTLPHRKTSGKVTRQKDPLTTAPPLIWKKREMYSSICRLGGKAWFGWMEKPSAVSGKSVPNKHSTCRDAGWRKERTRL